MPTGIDTVIGGLLAQQQMGLHQQEINEMMAARRDQMNEAMRWRMFLQQQSPAWANYYLRLQKEQETQAQNKAYTDYVNRADINSFPVAWRPKIMELRNYIAAHPEENVSALAKNYVESSKPGAVQLKTVDSMGPDGNPVKSFYAFEPNTGTMSGIPNPLGGSGGSTSNAPTAAPPAATAPAPVDPAASIRGRYSKLFGP